MIEFIQDQILQPSELARLYAPSLYGYNQLSQLWFRDQTAKTKINDVLGLADGDTIHTPRRAYFTALFAKNWIARNVVDASRSLKAGQVAFVHIASQRHPTTIPSNHCCYVQLIKPHLHHENYWIVRHLFRRNHDVSRYPGMSFTIHKHQLRNRVVLAELGTPGTTAYGFALRARSVMSPDWQRLYNGNRFADAKQRYADNLRDTRGYNRVVRQYGRNPRRETYAAVSRQNWLVGQLRAALVRIFRKAKAAQEGITPATADAAYAYVSFFTGSLPAGSSYTKDSANDYIYSTMTEAGHFRGRHYGCNHWMRREDAVTVGESSTPICQHCLTRNINDCVLTQATSRDGRTVWWKVSQTYIHEDGTRYTYAPPPVIGAYHSSKNVHTQPLPLLTGKPLPAKALKVGYELEFSEHDNTALGKQDIARRMAAALAPFNINGQKYATFEDDASVWFEMVSGYGAMENHRAAIHALLDGQPYRGMVTSHDGGRCGLHVHLDIPETLTHAMRLTQFYHATHNRKLIECVARRYTSPHVTSVPDKYQTPASRQYRISEMLRGYSMRDVLRSINDSRYEMVNWHNAPRSVEIRVFRGSLITETVLACLEFAVASWYFTRDSRPVHGTEAFLDFISEVDMRHETKNLREYLLRRGYDVFVSRENPKAPVLVGPFMPPCDETENPPPRQRPNLDSLYMLAA